MPPEAHPQSIRTSLRKRNDSSQVSHSMRSVTGISELQIRRVVAALEAGHAERNIAESERIPERDVRAIRKMHIDRLHRRMSAVGTVFGGMLDNLRVMHSEIDRDAFEELRERGVA